MQPSLSFFSYISRLIPHILGLNYIKIKQVAEGVKNSCTIWKYMVQLKIEE